MKQIYMFLNLWLIISLATHVNAQLINVNPDPNGEPWLAGGLIITPEIQAELDAIPELIMTKSLTVLPNVVDNSQKVWFRPIFN